MTPELKAKWVAALRSGGYKQGRRALKQEKKGELRYCCLGVLCEVAGYDWYKDIHSGSGMHYLAQNGNCGLPGVRVYEELGISGDFAAGLANLNDGGKKFTTIAKIIEKEVQ